MTLTTRAIGGEENMTDDQRDAVAALERRFCARDVTDVTIWAMDTSGEIDIDIEQDDMDELVAVPDYAIPDGWEFAAVTVFNGSVTVRLSPVA